MCTLFPVDNGCAEVPSRDIREDKMDSRNSDSQ
jgi:hypothetical protein